MDLELDTPTAKSFLEFVKGKIDEASKLKNLDHEVLEGLYAENSPITIDKDDVKSVLIQLKNKDALEEDVQLWACFLRWGNFPSDNRKPIFPIDIEYKLEDEDWIVEVVSRLDELGDLIDGTISEKEINKYLNE